MPKYIRKLTERFCQFSLPFVPVTWMARHALGVHTNSLIHVNLSATPAMEHSNKINEWFVYFPMNFRRTKQRDRETEWTAREIQRQSERCEWIHSFEHTINISNAKVNSILSLTDRNKLVNVFVLRVVSSLVNCGGIQNFVLFTCKYQLMPVEQFASVNMFAWF